LNHNDEVFLLHLELVLVLLLVGVAEGALELSVQLAHLLIDAKKNFLLAHNFDRLKAVGYFVRVTGEFGPILRRKACEAVLRLYPPSRSNALVVA